MMGKIMKKATFALLILASAYAQAQSPLQAQKARNHQIEMKRPKAHEFHERLMSAFGAEDFPLVVLEAQALKKYYPNSPFIADASYYIAVAYFRMNELELANQAFNDYLKGSYNLAKFEEAVNYKFEIATLFEAGAKKRLFGLKKMPKVVPAKDEALLVYDEVIAALPRSDMAAQSLYRKGNLLVAFEDYKESIETFQTLIRRFPKNPLTPKSFLAIGDVYLKQCRKEFPDPALVELAEVNLKRFQADYPSDPTIAQLKEQLKIIKEVFAEELLTIGNYYTKKKQFDSAFIYYKTLIKKYSDTRFRDLAYKQIDVLKKKSRQPEAFIVEDID